VRILVVDDDPEYAEFVSAHLKKAGHQVDVQHTGFGVVNRLAGRGGEGRQRPDLLVLDYRMPGLPGDAVMDMLSRRPEVRNVPVLLHTCAEKSVVQHALKAHPSAVFVSKTGNVAPLLEAVRSADRAHRPRLSGTSAG